MLVIVHKIRFQNTPHIHSIPSEILTTQKFRIRPWQNNCTQGPRVKQWWGPQIQPVKVIIRSPPPIWDGNGSRGKCPAQPLFCTTTGFRLCDAIGTFSWLMTDYTAWLIKGCVLRRQVMAQSKGTVCVTLNNTNAVFHQYGSDTQTCF